MLTRQYYINRLADDLRQSQQNGRDTSDEIRIGRHKYLCNNVNQLLFDIPYLCEGFSYEPFAESIKNLGIADEDIICKPRREYEIHLEKQVFIIKMRFDSRYGQHTKLIIQGEPEEYDITDKQPEDIAGIMARIDEQFGKWCKEWEAIAHEASLLSKRQDIEKMSVETLVHTKLKGLGVEYALEHGKQKSTLIVKADNRQISIEISHRRFVETCRDLVPTIQSTLEHLKQIPDGVEINAVDKKTKWMIS